MILHGSSSDDADVFCYWHFYNEIQAGLGHAGYVHFHEDHLHLWLSNVLYMIDQYISSTFCLYISDSVNSQSHYKQIWSKKYKGATLRVKVLIFLDEVSHPLGFLDEVS